ncbi:MAG: lysophospholipase [Proteobacteria bacterium]|nr:lysophospholipase [Pseudomonadota bacterium]
MLIRTISALLCAVVLACGLPALATAGPEAAPRTITFSSEDGLAITADLYLSHGPDAPFIVLFHQAGWSRGEYREIAPRLSAMGFNCMAIDQRSGKGVGGVVNQTARRAKEAGTGTTYVDALPDMRAALRHARKHHARGKLIAWGSSYSSALVLVISGQHPELLDATLSFAPGEYFARLGKSKTWIRSAAAKIRKPAFITSARNEQKKWRAIFAAIPDAAIKTAYIPKTSGQHGSRALWQKFSDSPGYWKAVKDFLASVR